MTRKLKQAGWSYAEDRRLLELAKSSKSPEEIARLMNRSPAAVYKMAIRLARPIRESAVVESDLMRPQISSDEAHRIAFGFSPPDDRYVATRLRDGLERTGHTPRRSRTEREQRAGQAAEEVGFRTCRGERKANAAAGFDDTGGDFQET